MAVRKIMVIAGVGLALAINGPLKAEDADSLTEVENWEEPFAETEPQVVADAACSYCPRAGYQDGFFIKSDDGCYSLKARGLIQFRHVANWRDINIADRAQYDPIEAGFQLNRANLFFSGRIGSPNLKYAFTVASNGASDLFMEEAQLSYEFLNGVVINAGRFRNLAFLREEATSYAHELTAERSFINEVFTIDYVQGFGVTRQGDLTRTQLVVSDGRYSGYFNNDFATNHTDLALSSRLDVKLAGDWDQLSDFASWACEDWGVFLGGAFHWENGEDGDDLAVNNLNNFTSWTLDGSIEGRGLSLYAAGVGRHWNNPGTANDNDQLGFLAQASYMLVPDKFEPFVRWEYIDLDGVFQDPHGNRHTPVMDSEINIVTIGVNRYFNKHKAKLTVDAMYALDPIPADGVIAPVGTNTGFLPDVSGNDNQLVFRTQMQLFY